MPRWPWSRPVLSPPHAIDRRDILGPEQTRFYYEINDFLQKECRGVRLAGFIAQAYSYAEHEGLCLPIAANYIACWIDSIRRNNFNILENYRRRVFRFVNDTQIVELLKRNRTEVVGDNRIFKVDGGRPRRESRSLIESMYRSRHGQVKHHGHPEGKLFTQPENFFKDPGIYMIVLLNHALAFVNYPHQKEGKPVSEYRFLDANTGEFVWHSPGLTKLFLTKYYDFMIREDAYKPIKWVTYYSLEDHPVLPGLLEE